VFRRLAGNRREHAAAALIIGTANAHTNAATRLRIVRREVYFVAPSPSWVYGTRSS